MVAGQSKGNLPSPQEPVPNVQSYYSLMDPRDILSDNIKSLMHHHGIASQNALSKLAKIDQTTIGRMLAKRHAAQVDKIQAIARVFDLDTWQMLVPHLDPSNPPVSQITAIEKDLYDRLRQAAEAISNKK
jgi:hypothetical protein